MGTRIAHMEFDLFVPGNLLFVCGHSVQTLNPQNNHADLIAGGDTGRGYVEGQGSDVRFNYPKSAIQTNHTHIVVGDE